MNKTKMHSQPLLERHSESLYIKKEKCKEKFGYNIFVLICTKMANELVSNMYNICCVKMNTYMSDIKPNHIIEYRHLSSSDSVK